MELIHNSTIASELEKKMRGRLARIGGKVDQLFNYRGCIVDDINVQNRRAAKYGDSIVGKLRYGYDLFEQELRFWRKGYRAVRDRKTFFYDIHEVNRYPEQHHRYDGILSSNVIEHSYNAIWFLLCMHLLAKTNGHHFHAIPCYRYTFDRYRTPTRIDHFLDDFTAKASEQSCERHAHEHYESALRCNQPNNASKPAFPHVHCHVFDEHNTRSLFELLFQEVTVDVIRTEQFSDVLVLCGNGLNERFRRDFADTLKTYPGGESLLSCA
jgi:hypothetical protein